MGVTVAGSKRARGARGRARACSGRRAGARFYVVELWNGSEVENQHGPFREQEFEGAARRVYRGLADPENTLLLCASVSRRGLRLSALGRAFLEGVE